MDEFNVRSINFPHPINCSWRAGLCGTNIDLGSFHMVGTNFMEECMCTGVGVGVGWRSVEMITMTATLFYL